MEVKTLNCFYRSRKFWCYSWIPLNRARLLRSLRYFKLKNENIFIGFALHSFTLCFELFVPFPWEFNIAGLNCIKLGHQVELRTSSLDLPHVGSLSLLTRSRGFDTRTCDSKVNLFLEGEIKSIDCVITRRAIK